MADYLIQDSTLTDIADAIRAKDGSSAPILTEDMADAIAAIPSGGGDPYEKAREILTKTIVTYVDDELTTIGEGVFYNCDNLQTLKLHGLRLFQNGRIFTTTVNKIDALAFPSLQENGLAVNCLAYFQGSKVDFGASFSGSIGANALQNSKVNTLILRYNGIVSLIHNRSMPNAFLSGGTGGTIYIPKVLYDHLGDGSALDYKAATNWSTLDSYGTITWAQIEGSIYETQYADGTPIPSV